MNTVIFFVVVLLVIFLGIKLNLNYGILGLAAAVIIGFIFLGLDVNAIIALFPVRILFMLLNAMLFYSFASANGTLEKIAQHLMYKFRGAKKVMPLILFLVAAIVSALGAGALSTSPIMSPIAFAVAAQLGFDPILASMAAWAGSAAGGMMPWGADANFISAWLAPSIGDAAAAKYIPICCFWTIVFNVVLELIVYIKVKGWKSVSGVEAVIEKPEPMNKAQKTTLITILGVIVLTLVPVIANTFVKAEVFTWMSKYLSVQALYMIGTCVLAFCKVADMKECLKKRVPWDMIMGVCGLATLMALCESMGAIDAAQNVLSAAPGFLLPGALALVCSVLSFFVTGMTVMSFLIPLLPAIAGACGAPVAGLAVIMIIGLNASSLSPFSTGGAVALSGCQDDKTKETLPNRQMVYAIVSAAVWFIFSAVGLISIGAAV